MILKTQLFLFSKTRAAHLFVVTLLLLGITNQLPAQGTTKQKKEQLQKQMKKLQDEIKNIEAAIKKTNEKKDKSMGEILSLQAKIRSREKLIGNINNQIGDLDENISETATDIGNKSAEVEKMKQDYANMLVKTYGNLNLQSQVTFLLSANSLYDAFRRYNYLLKVAEFRRTQAKKLQAAIGELEVKKTNLQEDKQEKEGLLRQQKAQKTDLENEKKDKDEAVAQLQEKEKKLRKQIIDKNKAAAQLNSRIQNIIEEEIRAARKKAEEEAKRKRGPTNTGTNTANTAANKHAEALGLTPEEQLVSKNFSNNKGKLPWPVERGHIVGQFGPHEHPALKGVMVENNGVDIKTAAGADARAIFGGTVIGVVFFPTTQNCVIVKHGEFFTAYSNIETVAVKTGQAITTKQNLGKLHTDKNEDLTKVHLEIWRGKDKLDPEGWLAN